MEQAALFSHKASSFQDKTEKEPALSLDESFFTRSRSENLNLPGKSLTIDTSLVEPQRSPMSPAVKALDLSCSSNDNPFTTEREKFRLFERHCSEVSTALFMSGDTVAKSHETLAKNGITHVVNCVGFTCGEYHKDKGIDYLTLYLEDSPNQDIGKVLYHVFDYIETAHSEGGNVLVHCTQGISRSAALCIAYIMYKTKVPYEEAFRGVKAVRGVTNPNIGFTCQLLHWEKEQTSPLEHRDHQMYNVAAFSRLDSKLLLLKSVNHRSTKSLDPRGVFVVEGDQRIYIWQGSTSLKPHMEGTQALVDRLLKYDFRGQAWPTEVIRQGEETREFLSLLGVTKSFRSLKRLQELEVYDKDYSILYQDPSGNLF